LCCSACFLEKGGPATPFLDRDGALFGRINLVDAVAVAFVCGLVPVAYASLVMFRPARPHVSSVEPAEVNKEERRIANGLVIRLKVKVRGDNLTPMLRAFIDDVPAIGFTFESPKSADVIVGDVPMGRHDLILYDGVQEVARVPGGVTILPTPQATVRIVGTLIQLDEATARSLRAGQRFEVAGHPAAEFLRLGDVEPDRHRLTTRSGHIESGVDGSWQRWVTMRMHCEPDPNATVCRIGTTTLGDPTLEVMTVPGAPSLRLLVSEVLPDAEPQAAVARIRVEGQSETARLVQDGDRDIRGGALDERTASVTAVKRDAGAGVFEIAVRLGLDRADDGWRYKSSSMEPGTPFSFVTNRYSLSGSVVSLVIDGR
jgi:hypothetical protein